MNSNYISALPWVGVFVPLKVKQNKSLCYVLSEASAKESLSPYFINASWDFAFRRTEGYSLSGALLCFRSLLETFCFLEGSCCDLKRRK